MEKEIGSKEVKMKPQKLSYNELNQACAEMSQQIQQQGKYIQQLHKQLQEMNFMLQNKRMDYLLKIVELQGKRDTAVFNDGFYFSCIAEIEESLTIPEKEDSEAKED
jgi:uncharacterized coiled-coil protein SlyX